MRQENLNQLQLALCSVIGEAAADFSEAAAAFAHLRDVAYDFWKHFDEEAMSAFVDENPESVRHNRHLASFAVNAEHAARDASEVYSQLSKEAVLTAAKVADGELAAAISWAANLSRAIAVAMKHAKGARVAAEFCRSDLLRAVEHATGRAAAADNLAGMFCIRE